jgi:hypothetical protein
MDLFKKHIKWFVISTFLLLSPLYILASDSISSFVPHIEGTVRTRYEYFIYLNENRFQVRNARLCVKGNFTPITSYKTEVDFSDAVSIKMLDAYIRVQPQKSWNLTFGQQKVPFSTDNIRTPYELYFASRSFIGNQLTNLHDVGISANYFNKYKLPVSLIIGVYNGMGIYFQNKTISFNKLSYDARLIVFPENTFQISLNANSICPGDIRMNYYDAGLKYDAGNFHFESEYFYKTYSQNTLLDQKITSGFVAFVAYDILTPKLKTLTKITLVFRFDCMSDNLKYDIVSSSILNYVVDDARNRITGGITLSLSKPFINDIRLNYEQYFGHNDTNSQSKFVAEYVVHF